MKKLVKKSEYSLVRKVTTQCLSFCRTLSYRTAYKRLAELLRIITCSLIAAKSTGGQMIGEPIPLFMNLYSVPKRIILIRYIHCLLTISALGKHVSFR